MEPLAERIKSSLNRKPKGAVISAKGLASLGARAAVDQALARMSRSGELIRVARGMYVAPVTSRFGRSAPPTEKVIASFARVKGDTITPNGLIAANRLGLTTQMPVRDIFLTSGRSGKLQLGRKKVELKHVPSWQIVAPNSPAGEAVRALAYMGKGHAVETARHIRAILPPSEWQALSALGSKLPGWMVEVLGEADRNG